MPSVNIHCEISKERTGSEYKELHEWIDKPHEYIGFNHRIERHAFLTDYKDYIEKKWGEKAVVEWLFHIDIDNLETANKFAYDVYSTNYPEIAFFFEDKDLIGADFIKHHPNSYKVTEYIKKGKKPLSSRDRNKNWGKRKDE